VNRIKEEWTGPLFWMILRFPAKAIAPKYLFPNTQLHPGQRPHPPWSHTACGISQYADGSNASCQ
jgi:hypothetical protein